MENNPLQSFEAQPKSQTRNELEKRVAERTAFIIMDKIHALPGWTETPATGSVRHP